MSGLTITLKDVKFEFNKRAILTPAEKAQKKLLDKFGGYDRKAQQNSLKRGKGPSPIFSPPHRHSERPDIKDTVFYFTDAKKKEVVIGMVLLSGKPGGDRAMPGVLEHAGEAQVMPSKREKMAGKGMQVIKVEARPSAQPAFEKTIKKQLPGLIAGGIMREV